MKITFKNKCEKTLIKFAESYYKLLKRLCLKSIEILEPLPCGYPKIKEFYRYQVLIKTHQVFQLGEVLKKVEKNLPLTKGTRVLIDVDPSSTFF